jgi:hypothetical protein
MRKIAAAFVVVVSLLTSGPLWAYCWQWAEVEVESDGECYDLYDSNVSVLAAEYSAAQSVCNNVANFPNCYNLCEEHYVALLGSSFGCATLCSDGASACYNQADSVYNISMLYYAEALNGCLGSCPG